MPKLSWLVKRNTNNANYLDKYKRYWVQVHIMYCKKYGSLCRIPNEIIYLIGKYINQT